MAEEKLALDYEGVRLPYSVEAEQSVLGAILVDPKSISLVAAEMRPEYFYIPQHKEIYKTLSSMFELNQTIDFISLLERLKNDGVYDEAGGKAYLTQLAQIVPSAANIATYAGIVRERYYARSLILAAQSIIKDASENVLDAGLLLDTAEQRIFEIRQGRDLSGLTHIRDVIEGETYDRLRPHYPGRAPRHG